jgi:NADH:ubiquinone oxidoreductase subunit E
VTTPAPRLDRGGRAAIQREQPEVPEAAPTEAERTAADRVLARYPAFRRDQLLPVLHEVHAETGWFSEELTRYLSQRLGVPFADLYGVISFYALFKTKPAARTVIRVCKGLPCYLHGAYAIGEHLQDLLGLAAEGISAEGDISWEWFACLGQCEYAPALLVGEEPARQVTPESLEELVEKVRHGRGRP